MTNILLLVYQLTQSVEINYACIDQHIDAKFKNYDEAKQYVEYFKPHHHYEIVPILTYERNNNTRGTE